MYWLVICFPMCAISGSSVHVLLPSSVLNLPAGFASNLWAEGRNKETEALESLKLWFANRFRCRRSTLCFSICRRFRKIYWFSLHSAGWALGSHISEVIIICDPDLYSWVGSQSNFPNFFSRSSLETDSVKWALCTVAQRADARGLEETWCGESIFFLKHERSPSPLRHMHV